MGGVCKARNCFRSKDKCPDLPFFTFPKNPISAKKWIANIGDPELLKRPHSALKNSVVCALHFEEKCFVNKKKRTLVRNAVPTIFNIPPLRTQESNENGKRSKSNRTEVPECNSGAVFSCNVETFDSWHHQIDAVTEQLLCLLPENSSHTSQVKQQAERRCVDASTQYENESDSREFENRLNDLNKVTNFKSSDLAPRVQLLCRLCSKLTHRESVMQIFGYEGEKIQLEIMINSIMVTKVIQDDGLPMQVCNVCVRKLTFCYDLRKEFLASEKRLRDLLGIPAPKDSVEVPGTKGNAEEQSTVLESPSAEVITPPAENTTEVQLKGKESSSVAVQTEETAITQSETPKRGPRKRKKDTAPVENTNTRRKDDKIPKLTKSSPRGRKSAAENTPKSIKSTPRGKKTIAEDTQKSIKSTPQGEMTLTEDIPKLMKSTPQGKRAIAEDTPKLIKSTPQGKRAIAEDIPKLIKSTPRGKRTIAEDIPKLIKSTPQEKKTMAEDTPKLIKSTSHGEKAAAEESPKVIKAGPRGKKSTGEEVSKLIKAGSLGRKSTGEEVPKLVKTGTHGKKATVEEIPELLTDPHGKTPTSEEIPNLIKTGHHGKMSTIEDIPNLMSTSSHGKMDTVKEIPNLVKTGPREKNSEAEESDFENDSNYEIHWYDEAYDDSISEDMGTGDSILNNKKMFVNNAKNQLTSEAAKLMGDPIADVEMKSIDENDITTLNHKKLNESKVDEGKVKDIHMNDSKVNDTKVNENVNKIPADTDISVPITNSNPSPKEGTLSGVSIRQKIGSGSVKVRLMTERQKLLKLRMKTQNKLLKQGSKKSVLPAKNSCPECNKSFSSKLNLERHILMHRKFECAVCTTIFNTSEELSNHSRENCLSKLKAVTDAATTAHECEICRRTFKTRQRLFLHSKTHSRIVTHSTIIPYTCKFCPKAFPTRIRLKQHLKIHKPEKSFKCLICNESFKNNKALFQHRVQHTKSSPTLKCETCTKFFTNVKEYEKHREEHTSSTSTIHVNGASTAEITSDTHDVDKLGGGSGLTVDTSSKVEEVQGMELTKTVKEDGIMKVKVPHLEKNLIITSADQFICDICDCKFSSQHFQEEHKKVHHSLPKQSSVPVATSPVESTVELLQTPERGKLYFCDQCGEGYERKRSLALHRFSHTSSHRCPHCHQSFSSEDSLTRHLENCLEVEQETNEGNNKL